MNLLFRKYGPSISLAQCFHSKSRTHLALLLIRPMRPVKEKVSRMRERPRVQLLSKMLD